MMVHDNVADKLSIIQDILGIVYADRQCGHLVQNAAELHCKNREPVLVVHQRFQADKKRNIFAVLAAAGYGLASGHVNDSKDDRGDGAENGRQLDPCALTAPPNASIMFMNFSERTVCVAAAMKRRTA